MATTRKSFRAVEDYCLHAATGEEALPGFFSLLRSWVDNDHAAYFRTDEQGRVCGAYHEVPRHAQQAGEFIRRASAGTDATALPTLPSVAELFRMPVPVQTLRFDSPKSKENELCRDVIGPIRGEHVLRVGLRVGNRPAGLVALVRGKTQRPFLAAEAARLVEAARPLARLVARAPAADERLLASEGFLIVSRSGQRLHVCPEGQRLWTLLEDSRFLPELDGQLALGTLLAELDAAAVPELRRDVHTGWGKFELIAVPLRDAAGGPQGAVLVRIRRWVLARLLHLDRMAQLGLSSMQKRVCLDLLAGLTQTDIAQEHGIGVQTVISHVRAVYDKAGVGSRAELQRLFRSES